MRNGEKPGMGDKGRGARERRHFAHPVQWISDTVFCPGGQFMHWNPELLHSMRHLVSSMCITPGREWEITLAPGQQRPLETGWGVWNLRNYVSDCVFLFKFLFSSSLRVERPCFLKGNSHTGVVMWFYKRPVRDWSVPGGILRQRWVYVPSACLLWFNLPHFAGVVLIYSTGIHCEPVADCVCRWRV